MGKRELFLTQQRFGPAVHHLLHFEKSFSHLLKKMGCLLSTKQCLISTFLSSLNVCRSLRGSSSFMRLCSVTAKVSQAILPQLCKGEKRTANPYLPCMDCVEYDCTKSEPSFLFITQSDGHGKCVLFCVVIQKVE